MIASRQLNHRLALVPLDFRNYPSFAKKFFYLFCQKLALPAIEESGVFVIFRHLHPNQVLRVEGLARWGRGLGGLWSWGGGFLLRKVNPGC